MLYQHGTLGTLMAGILDGTATIDEILKKGDLGIGTLTGCDGEVIIVNGVAYHADALGGFRKLSGSECTPYATVTPFEADYSYFVPHITDADSLLEDIKGKAASENIFFAVKITGKFETMHVRMMPKQEKPYTKLKYSADKQPEFVYEQINGTVVGFYTPELFHGIAASGFHLHFVDEDKAVGGHILDFELNSGTIEISNIETLEQHFPVNDQAFLESDIDHSTVAEDINEIE
ncbi:acetolactate decarboxylase [Staphylococcus gallinarum]|jgi:acetolactate decarboxylase|uniref:Alpha-acetolactate decarboxylase n=1 Tax=Staphylococcus gallinarum TaxID=1293 RepID=A0A418HQ93_STAGA|nr:acetolactate decarboxylase [Staphylococcus gallinarum]MCD8826844.1 acetolactate decarboxylase [Staphylococcus gallinarum]MCQ9288614.1 acetolactate decarboxylase [Staphylococcus gallinarum]RIL43835.1 acetolactate decarboxylase [Staphylococcus gallinarum]RIO95311.1 acetolactate decarboxylase [Staphylococcus gallinarum]